MNISPASVPTPDEMQAHALRILRALKSLPAHLLFYGTALTAIAILPVDPKTILVGLGVNALSGLIDRLRHGQNPSDDEIREAAKQAIADSQIEHVLIDKQNQAILGRLIDKSNVLKIAVHHAEYTIVEQITSFGSKFEVLIESLRTELAQIQPDITQINTGISQVDLKVEMVVKGQQDLAAMLDQVLRVAPLPVAPAQVKARVFLSYARADDEAFVKHLYEDLTTQGYDVWWDRARMPSRGLTFLQEIRDAITTCDRLILVVGPGAVVSNYVRAEWEYALTMCCQPVIPLLRLGDYDLIPPKLKDFHAPDCREARPYDDAFKELLRTLEQPAAPLGKLFGVPDLPNWYIERPDDLRQLIEAVCADTRQPIIVTSKKQVSALVGMGGIGKSTLASAVGRNCEVRHTFKDGVFWLEMGNPPDLVSSMKGIALALGDDGQKYDTLKNSKMHLGALLGSKATLLVLDDIWDHQAVQDFRVLGNRCRLVVTTRQWSVAQKLGITPQHVDTLTEDEGLRLIGERLGRDPDAPNPHESVERQIIHLLGGHTLAVSLAAAKLDEEGPDHAPALLASLKTRKEGKNPFWDLAMDDTDKNLNLELCLSLSYGDLPPDMQRRFRALGVFVAEGTFDAAALAAVWDDSEPDTVEAGLKLLRRAGLLVKTGERYSQHNLLRAYARALLVRHDELDTCLRRHFEHYASLHGDFDANNDEDRHPLITPDFENIRAALTWGFEHTPEHACEFTDALNYYMQFHQSYATRRQLLSGANYAAERTGYARGQANTLKALGELDVREAAYPSARQRDEQALALFEVIPDRLGQANTLKALGELDRMEAAYPSARQRYEQALALFEAFPDRLGQANTLLALGELDRMEDAYPSARQRYEQALALFEVIPDRLGQANTLKALGELDRMEAAYPSARQRYEQAQALFEAIPDRLGQASTLKALGELDRMEDAYPSARQRYEQALALFEVIPDRLGQANTLQALGDLDVREAAYPSARQRYEQALALFEVIPDRLGQANTLKALGELDRMEDAYPSARQRYEQALALFEVIPQRLGQASTLKALGELDRMEDAYPSARQRYEQALALFEVIPQRLGQASTLKALGELDVREDAYPSARQRYEQALALFEVIPQRLGQANTLLALGDLDVREDAYPSARQRDEQALALFEAIPQRLGQANTLLALAELDVREAAYPSARQRDEQALALFEAIPDRLGQANTLKALGELDRMEAAYPSARQRYEQALALFEAFPDRLGQANTLKALGELDRMEDAYPSARQRYEQALALFEVIPDRLGQANTLKALGELDRMEAAYPSARQRYEQALALFEVIPDRLGQANTLKALGDLDRMEDAYPSARQRYEQALALFEVIPQRLGQASTLKALGELDRMEDAYPSARQRYEQALALFEVIPDRLGQASTLKALGELDVREDAYPSARQRYEQALALFEAIPQRLGQANTLLALAELDVREDAYPSARQRYEQALALFEVIPDRLGQANTLLALAELDRMEDAYPSARQRYEQALALFEVIPQRLGQANTLLALGDLDVREDAYPSARQRYEQALALFEAIPQRLGQANTLQALGDLDAREAAYPSARQRYEQALALFEAIPQRLGQANTLKALGDLDRMEAAYPSARQRYEQALALFEVIPDRLGQANTLLVLAELDVREAAYPSARQRYEQALALFEVIPDRLGQANTLKALGDLDRMEDAYPSARQRYEQALALFEVIPDRLGQANTLQALGDLDVREDAYPSARQRYEQALALFEVIPDRLGQANTLQALGDLDVREDAYPSARQRYEQALALFEVIPNRLGQANTLTSQGDMEVGLKNWQAALDYYNKALPIVRGIGVRLSVANILVDMGRARFELGDLPGGIQDMREALALFQVIGDKRWANIARQRLAEMLERSGQVEEAQSLRSSGQPRPLLNRVIDFINTGSYPDKRKLVEQDAALLSDEAYAVFDTLLEKLTGQEALIRLATTNRTLLRRAREYGIAPVWHFELQMCLGDNVAIPDEHESAIMQVASLLASTDNAQASLPTTIEMMIRLIEAFPSEASELYRAALCRDSADAMQRLPADHALRRVTQIEAYYRTAISGYEAAQRPISAAYTRRSLGNLLTSQGRYGDAVEVLRLAADGLKTDEERKNDAAWACSAYASALDNLGQDAESIAAYDEAIRLLPNTSPLLRTRAETLIHVRRLDEAEADLQRAVELDGNEDSPYLWNRRAQLAIARGSGTLAQQMIEEVLKRKADHDVVLPQAQAAWLCGDPVAAEELLRKSWTASNEGDRAAIRRQMEQLLTEHPDLAGIDTLRAVMG